MKGKPVLLVAVLTLLFSLGLSAQEDTQRAQDDKQLDTLRRHSMSLGTNLFYWGSGTPNAHFWFPVGNHFTLGVTGGLKPWPRWLPWDFDEQVESKWRHFAIVPQMRWWPKENYRGLWLGADLLWTHYNVGGVTFPFGMYPEVQKNRLQGDFFGLGISIGRSWWLTDHLRLEAEIGAAAGYNTAKRYECSWCGALLGNVQGPAIVPKLGLNLAYNFFDRKTRGGGEEIETITSPVDTLTPPEAVEPPEYFRPDMPAVEDWKGIAGTLEKDHAVLRPSSEYQPYTSDRILRKEESPLYVFFELDKSVLKREFNEPTAKGEASHRNNGPVLDEIMDITSKILADTTSSVTKIQIIGLASVEGSQKHNQALSDARALALQHYIQDRLPIGDDLFDTVGGGAAWTEFRDAVNDLLLEGGGAGLNEEQLRSILQLIDSEPNPVRREAKLRKSQVYKTLREYVLGDQRNSGYLRIYYDYVPDENARCINEAIGMLEEHRYSEALEVLEDVKDDPRCLNAYASALYWNGREAEALEVYRKAAATDETAAANLEKLEECIRQREAYEKHLKAMEEYVRLRYGR